NMVASGSLPGQPHADAFHRRCITSSHSKSGQAQGTGLVGGCHCPLVFATASPYERPGYSKLSDSVHPSSIPALFPPALLHAIGSGFAAKRVDRHTTLVDDRILLRIDRL